VNNSLELLDKVYNVIIKYEMTVPGDKVLVALSGGADSVCLLSVMHSLKERLGIEVYAAHLNHMIRGEEAERDEQFAKKLCEFLGVRCFVKHTDVPEIAEKEGLSVEEAGRKARYDFFGELKEKEKITKIATAHNKNDRAETVFMRIMRGTGIDGLQGIAYKREDGVIRPVLDVSRGEIEDYLKENNMDFCTDSTNSDNDYTRNRIRNELLPYIKENFNPSIVDTLVRFSDIASEDAEFLNGYAERLYERINNPLPSHKPCALHIDTLKMLEASIKTRLIRMTAKKAAECDLKLQYAHIRDILDLIEKNTGAAVELPCDVRVRNEYGWLIFENTKEIFKEERVSEEDLFIRVSPLESYLLENISAEIKLGLVDPTIYKKNAREQLLDFEKLEGKKLIMRNRQSGDKIVCFDDGREKKIKSIFIDSKIPKASRNKIPLLCADGEVVAIIGLRISEKYKINKETRKALKIEYRKIENND